MSESCFEWIILRITIVTPTSYMFSATGSDIIKEWITQSRTKPNIIPCIRTELYINMYRTIVGFTRYSYPWDNIGFCPRLSDSFFDNITRYSWKYMLCPRDYSNIQDDSLKTRFTHLGSKGIRYATITYIVVDSSIWDYNSIVWLTSHLNNCFWFNESTLYVTSFYWFDMWCTCSIWSIFWLSPRSLTHIYESVFTVWTDSIVSNNWVHFSWYLSASLQKHMTLARFLSPCRKISRKIHSTAQTLTTPIPFHSLR